MPKMTEGKRNHEVDNPNCGDWSTITEMLESSSWQLAHTSQRVGANAPRHAWNLSDGIRLLIKPTITERQTDASIWAIMPLTSRVMPLVHRKCYSWTDYCNVLTLLITHYYPTTIRPHHPLLPNNSSNHIWNQLLVPTELFQFVQACCFQHVGDV